VKKILTWLALIVAVIWAVHNPHQLASDVHQLAHALTTFVSAL
jgi:hypothetical protein